jgi:hypothetical protein
MKVSTKNIYIGLFIANLLGIHPALAGNYSLSADGTAVVRVTPTGKIPANSINTSLFPPGWTAKLGTGGTTKIVSLDAGFMIDSGASAVPFRALYTGSPLPSGSRLDWVQTVSSNVTSDGRSPFIDNAKDPTVPFYSQTAANLLPGLLPGQINFYDRPARSREFLETVNPINWSAKLYPVRVDPNSKQITVYDGVSWGFKFSRATIGLVAGRFNAPTPSRAITAGTNTANFKWGTQSPSSIAFNSAGFDTLPNTVFKLGTLTYRNGASPRETSAEQVNLSVLINFINVPEKNFKLDVPLTLINTLNNADPVASADRVSLGSWGYTFNVVENQTASVDIFAKLTTDLTSNKVGATIDGATFEPTTFERSPNYKLSIVSIANATPGGFITSNPTPKPIATPSNPPESVPTPQPQQPSPIIIISLGLFVIGVVIAIVRILRR